MTDSIEALAADVQTRITEMRVSEPAGAEDAIAGEQAERSVRRYLDDGFDARLLLEQVAVLRRAQSHTASKSSGRPIVSGSATR